MNSQGLKSYCLKHSHIKPYFGGVVPKNLIPISLRRKPIFYIVNTAASYENGQHWVVLWFDHNTIEYFDSLGSPPSELEIERSLSWHGPDYVYNSTEVQGHLTKTCGQFCLFYIYFKARGLSMTEIVAKFNKNYILNDVKVKFFYDITK